MNTKAILLNTACVMALIISAVAVSGRLTFELHAPLNWDSPIYWAVGRGILNGLRPYRDLIEAKPPGIFVVSALAGLSADPEKWYGIFQFGALLLMFLSPAVILARLPSRPLDYCLPFIVAFPTSAIFTLFCAERAGNFQVESFGACMITYYATFLRADLPTTKWKRRLLMTVLLSAGIGFKEPFVIIAAACAIISCRSLRQFWEDFCLPLALGLLLGMAVLITSGVFETYLSHYVFDMFSSHLYRYNDTSLLERGLLISPLKGDLFSFSSYFVPLLGALAAASFFTTKPSWMGLTALRLGAAAYLTALAVGAGGSYFGHHFAFASPAYYSLLFVAISSTRCPNQRLLSRASLGATALAGILAISIIHQQHLVIPVPMNETTNGAIDGTTNSATNYSVMTRNLQNWAIPAKATATTVDAILDQCGLERYQFIGHNGPQPYGYTKHSPLGPLFYFDRVWLDEHHQLFQSYLLKQLEQAKLVVIDFQSAQLAGVQDKVTAILREQFSSDPWPCARAYQLVPEPYALLFRRGREDANLKEE